MDETVKEKEKEKDKDDAGSQELPTQRKRGRGRPPKTLEEKTATKTKAKVQSELPSRPRGGQPSNQNAVKEGNDLRLELFLSKFRRSLLEEWFSLTYGRPALGENELREVARQMLNRKLDQTLYEEIEQRKPGRFSNTGGEVY